jgi:hypothetical protein
VDTNILRTTPEKVGPDEERPHCCYDGWVYLSYEGVDEDGELVEVDTERVPCRRCAAQPAGTL